MKNENYNLIKKELVGKTLMCIDSEGKKTKYGKIKKIELKTLEFEAGDHLPISTMEKWIKKGKMWFKGVYKYEM